MDIDIRESTATDMAAIEDLYRAAFPEEDLLPLVASLLDGRDDVLSLVAEADGGIVGNVIFTFCGTAEGDRTAALLAPLAVAPACQKQGIGSRLVRAGFEKLENTGARHVCVLGDPAYYGSFGFTAEPDIAPPHALPAAWRDAWQSRTLGTAKPPPTCTLNVPEPWQPQALWLP